VTEQETAGAFEEAWVAPTVAELGRLSSEGPPTIEIAVGPLEAFLLVAALQAILSDSTLRLPGPLRELLAERARSVQARLPKDAADRLDELWQALPPACRICGCTEESACPGGCSWVEDPAGKGELCSTCLPLVTR